MPQPSHHRRNPMYVELLRRYTQARSHYRTVLPLLIAQGLQSQMTEREYSDLFVDHCFPPLVGEILPGEKSRSMAFEEADLEVFR